ncbi:MAG TPA: hypothetical protein VFV70_04885, partial [Hyphomonadaceae bacterium]|nr:hypothetical protein [Hyphomonadaceae bacterium]
MKDRQPLWLICDLPACLRLHGALAILGTAVRCCLSAGWRAALLNPSNFALLRRPACLRTRRRSFFSFF